MLQHMCHWPGCTKVVAPNLWGCKRHWLLLPKSLRNKIWASYRPGQEVDKQPSKAYLDVARSVQDWIQTHRYPDGLPWQESN